MNRNRCEFASRCLGLALALFCGNGWAADPPSDLTALKAARDRQLARELRSEEWSHAIRAFPGGIPPGARLQSLEDVSRMPLELAPRPGGGEEGSGGSIQGSSWFPIGPAPVSGFFPGGGSGRATALAVNPMNLDEVWLGAANGGVWHSINGGTNWVPISDNEASLAIGALQVDDCTSGGCLSVYAGTGENSLRRDTYYGAGLLILESVGEFPSWRLSGQSLFNLGSINNIVLDPTTSGASKRIYVTLSSGVTASATESTVTAPDPPMGFGIYESNDKGLNWTKLTVAGTSGAKPTDLEMDPQDHNVLYAGFLGKGIFKTTNGGTSWCPLNPGITLPGGCSAASGLPNPTVTASAFDRVEIAIHRPSPASPAVLYAVFGNCPSLIVDACNPSIYKSTDGGSTWTLKNSSAPSAYSRYTHLLVIHPTTPETIFYGGLELWKSTNSGQNFTASESVSGGILHLDHHAAVFHPLNANRMYEVCDGGFASSTNGGSTWTPSNNDLQTFGFQSISSSPLTNKVIGGAQDNGVNMWTGSRTWDFKDDSDGGATLLDLDNALKMYDTIQYGTPRRSVDGGSSWTSSGSGIDTTEPAAFYPPFVQSAGGSHSLYYARTRLYLSADDAGTWTAVSPVLGGSVFFPDIQTANVITAIGVAPSNPNRIYLGHYDGQVWVSKSGGPCAAMSCWTKKSTGLPTAVVTRIAVHPTDPDTAYATFSGFQTGSHVWKTTNGGSNWAAASGSGAGQLPNTPVNTITIEPSTPLNLWLGTDVGVFKSTDGGTSWARFSSGLPRVAVYEISIDEGHGRVFAGTHGRGAFVLTEPFLSNFEGWVNGSIWDIPVYGHGFLPGLSCSMRIVLQNGAICAQGTLDAMGATINTDSTGRLVTSSGGFYSGQPVAWACFNGNCVGGVNISSCNTPGNRISTVEVFCGTVAGTQVGIDKVLGCPQQNQPPSNVISLLPLPPGPSLLGIPKLASLEVVATVQTGDQKSRALCAVTVPYGTDEPPADVLLRVEEAMNNDARCLANGVKAEVKNLKPDHGDEDQFVAVPELLVTAAGISGGELVTSLHAAAGNSPLACLRLGHLGVPVLDTLMIMKLKFEVLPAGAQGGQVSLAENSTLGTCAVTVRTFPGESAEEVAGSLAKAFHAKGIPGPLPDCPSDRNPRDVVAEGDSLIMVLPSGLEVCVLDGGLGFSLAPEEILGSELWVPGSSLYINCGGSEPVGDRAGRIWRPDAPFLAPNQPPTNVAVFPGSVVETSNLTDRDVPNEVLISERWRDGDIAYQIPVPNGDYRVVLYFAEDCPACVGPAFGGTGCGSCARIFDLEVEGQRVDNYNQADAAMLPPGDGKGAIFKASEVAFEVAVNDGLLDIRIIDKGRENPPENASIKALAILPGTARSNNWMRCDSNGDHQNDISDPVLTLGLLFLGSKEPACAGALDCNGDGRTDISDAVYNLNFLFTGGPPPPLPYPACDGFPGCANNCF